MKNFKLFYALVAMLLLGFVFTQCNRTNDIKPKTKANANRSARIAETACGTETTCTLWAGQTINAGTITVENDNTNLYVTYNTTGIFGTLHLWVGTDLTLVPSSKSDKGTPVPGKFPYKYTTNGETTYTFTIPLNKIPGYDQKCGTGSRPIYVVAHAEVTINGNKETAFGGCVPGTGPRWWYYAVHTLQCCDTPPPTTTEKLGTAFAYGNFVFTTDPKSNPEKLPSLSLIRNRWGWANNLIVPSTTTQKLYVGAGLNSLKSAIEVGTVTIDWNSTQATITYTLNAPYTMEVVHIYADDTRPTTTAPGQYGYIATFDPFTNTHTVTLDVVDTNTDGIWVIAHAIVYGPKISPIL
jgi:hypothetical protein